MKKIITVILSLILILPTLISPTSVKATDSPSPPVINDGKAYCLYNVTQEKYVVVHNPDEIINTSTSAKVMMGLIACEMLSDRLDEFVVINEDMIKNVSGHSMKLEVGERIKIIDLLYGAICASYNDAAYALSHICGHSVAGFVDIMNRRASELGATSTSYSNPIGYPDNSAMVTTLSDTLKIALAASQNELYMEISSQTERQISSSDKTHKCENKNELIKRANWGGNYYNSRCKGMNAGYSGIDGGWSIVTMAQDDGAEYICIILGGTESDDGSQKYAYEAVNTLINWACEAYGNHSVFKEGQKLGEVEIGLTALGSTKTPYYTKNDLDIYIPEGSHPNISYKVEFYSSEINAPIEAGEEIGIVRVFCNEEEMGQCPIIIKESHSASTIMLGIYRIGEYTKSRAFIATLICFAILLTICLIIRRRNNRYGKRYKRRY